MPNRVTFARMGNVPKFANRPSCAEADSQGNARVQHGEERSDWSYLGETVAVLDVLRKDSSGRYTGGSSKLKALHWEAATKRVLK